MIHPECRHTADEFATYAWKQDKQTEEILPELEDDHNHCVAEGELVTTTRGSVPVENVTPGDFVLTRKGFREVLAAWKASDDREVLPVRAGGKCVWVTSDHEIFCVRKGFTRADAMRYGDEVIVTQDVEQWAESRLSSFLDTTIGAIPTRAMAAIAGISDAAISAGRLFCTATFGNIITGLSLMGGTFTTKTATFPITNFQILNACPVPTTYPDILRIGTAPSQSGRANILLRSAISRRVGIVARKATQSIKRLGLSLIDTLFLRPRSVQPAAMSSCRTLSGTRISSVQTPASQHPGARLALITKRGLVRFAVQVSRSIGIPRLRLVRARAEIGSERRRCAVYDLTVDEHHEFVAGGIVVSNCVDACRYGIEKLRRAPPIRVSASLLERSRALRRA